MGGHTFTYLLGSHYDKILWQEIETLKKKKKTPYATLTCISEQEEGGLSRK